MPSPSLHRAGRARIRASGSSHVGFAQGAKIDRVALACGRGNRARMALNRSQLIRPLRCRRPSQRPLRDLPHRWVKPRKSNRFCVSCPPVTGRKSTQRVLVGWSASPCYAKRAPRAASTRSPSLRFRKAMTKSSAWRTSRKAPASGRTVRSDNQDGGGEGGCRENRG